MDGSNGRIEVQQPPRRWGRVPRPMVVVLVGGGLFLAGLLFADAAGASEGPVFHEDVAPTEFGEPSGVRYPTNVGGTYVPLALRCGLERRILWYAPGAPSDSLWRSVTLPTSGAVTSTTQALAIAGTYQPVVGDLDGDGCDDVLWYAPGPDNDAVWYFAADGTHESRPLTIGGTRQPLVGNFDADPTTDEVFWYGPGAEPESIWTVTTSNGSVVRGDFADRSAPQVAGTFQPMVDKRGVVLWYATGAAQDYVWFGMQAGSTTVSSATTTIGGTYQARTVGGYPLLWTPSTGAMQLVTSFSGYQFGEPVPPSVGLVTVPAVLEQFTAVATSTGRTGFTVLHAAGAQADWVLRPDARPGATSVATSAGTASTDGASCATAGPSGLVMCWGNGYGAAGSDTGTPRVVRGVAQATQVAVSRDFGCARRSDARVLCWGANNFGQLGRGSIGGPQLDAALVPGVADVVEVGVGRDYACARKGLRGADGIVCWGRNQVGQLGAGSTVSASGVPLAVLPPPLGASFATVSDLDVGLTHACAIASGVVHCWGGGSAGQLGNGTTAAVVRRPGPIDECAPGSQCRVTPARSVGVGDRHSCARFSSGLTKCWGDDTYGQLGNGLGAVSTTRPAIVVGLPYGGISTPSGGANRTCGLVVSAGPAVCWGSNAQGVLGAGGPSVTGLPPATIPGQWRQISVGGQHACGLRSSSGAVTVQCWGLGGAGQLGRGRDFRGSPTPVATHALGVIDLAL